MYYSSAFQSRCIYCKCKQTLKGKSHDILCSSCSYESGFRTIFVSCLSLASVFRHQVPVPLVTDKSGIAQLWVGSGKNFRNLVQAQSRQSAKLFLQSSELELPHPLTRWPVVVPPPPLVPGGGDSLPGGVPIPTRDIHCGSTLYMVCLTSTE